VGKTLLLDDVLRGIAGQFSACRVNQPHIGATELLQALLIQLGSPAAEGDTNRSRLLHELAGVLNSAGARGGARPLLIIDDAQLLPGATLHVLGEILADAPRMKILLVGQDDQEQRGADIAAGIAVAQKPRQVRLTGLSADGTKAYVEHRLRVAGGGGKELFTLDAYKMIFRHTGGTARLINVLCDAALHAACLRASGQVGAAEILAATQDSRWPDAVAREKARPNAPPQALDEEFPSDSPSSLNSAPTPDSPPSWESQSSGQPPLQVAPPRAQLVVSHREEHIATRPLETGRISIGRASDNALRLDAPFVSRHHCQIVTAGKVSIIEDLGSVNGMTVNGKAVKRHVLQNADQVMIGEHVLTYVVR
jgi:type II secretory pathway predicted ATPase ExeA